MLFEVNTAEIDIIDNLTKESVPWYSNLFSEIKSSSLELYHALIAIKKCQFLHPVYYKKLMSTLSVAARNKKKTDIDAGHETHLSKSNSAAKDIFRV